MSTRKRILTGMKPTGQLHLGNYCGAIRPAIELSHQENNEVILFCPDWHGLTNKNSIFVPGQLTHENIATYLALGFNIKNNIIILQSDFPQIQENAWYLSCACSAGLLERSHAYKDALASGKEATAGLLFYPVLMASDIVTFDAEIVPVGKDQSQHLEYASDMVKLFNNLTKVQVYKEPKALNQSLIVMPGTDGRKMSKSYQNIIPIFASKKEIEKSVKEIKTDSKGLNDPKNPDECLVFQIFQSFASPEAITHMKTSLEKGTGYGYGHAKNDFIQEHERVFGSRREAFEDYKNHPEKIKSLIQEGTQKAIQYANATVKRARTALGLQTYL